MINSEELLFCVDDNNNPIEPLPRKFVHANSVWHRVSHIYVVNTQNKQILCQQRSLKKDALPGIQEAYFGGHVLSR